MKRITTTNAGLSRHSIRRLASELRATRYALSQHARPAVADDSLSFFVSDSSYARYLSKEDAAARRPLCDALSNAQDAIRFCERHFQAIVEQGLQEEFHILTLDAANRVLRSHCVTVGLLYSTPTHPREVFRPAFLDAAASIIAVHNHPSGDSSPSDADVRVTRALIDAGNLLGIKLLDHVVLSRHGSYSFNDRMASLFDSSPSWSSCWPCSEQVPEGSHAKDQSPHPLSENHDGDGGKRIYRVIASSCQSYRIYVHATSDLEALEIAERVDGAYWQQDNSGDWEVDYAEEVPDASPDALLPPEAYDTL